MATGYPFKKYNFNVLIDGKAVGYFSEVSAPEMADEPIEYRAGDHQAGTPVKMPGLKKYGNATLRWGPSVSRYLTDWFESVERGEFERKNVTIELLDDCQKVMARWQLVNAWPVKHCVPGFNAESDDFAYYVRPYAMFASEVDREKYPEVEQQYRFELTEEEYD